MNLSNTVVVDAQGQPLAVYRGEHGMHDHFIQSLLPSISFGDEAAARQYAMHPNQPHLRAERPRILKAYLNITKPVFNRSGDSYVDYDDLVELVGLRLANRMFCKFAEVVMATDAWADMVVHSLKAWRTVESLIAQRLDLMSQLCIQVYPLLDDPEFIEHTRSLGFDGAIHMGSGFNSGADEYRVFDQNQIVFIGEERLQGCAA
jgi:hypothetical protein